MGFFTTIQNNNPQCGKCGLFKKSTNPRMGFQGEGKKKILLLSKAPSSAQDKSGDLFVGEATNILRKELKEVGIDLERDCWIVSALGCQASGLNTNQLKNDIDYCRPRIKKIINKLNPSIILCLGTASLVSIFGEKHGKEQITGISADVFRSYLIPNYEYNCNVVGIHHPVEALQNQDDIFFYSMWKRDIQQFTKWVDFPLKEKVNHRANVVSLFDYNETISILEDILEKEPEWFVYDYEGTGTDIFIEGSRIETVSFSPIYDIKNFDRKAQKAYAFPYQRLNHFTKNQQERIKELWQKILVNPNINKVAHNFALEVTWDYVGFEVESQGVYWDSVVVANQINCTPGTRGLKLQALFYEGETGYGSEAKSYFERKQENGLNYIHEFPLNKLLLYNGLDSLFNALVFVEQYNYFKCYTKRSYKPRKAVEWYNKIAKEMAYYHAKGVNIDLDYYKEIKIELQTQLDDIIKQLNETDEVRAFVKKEGRLPNYTSAPDLRLLFFEHGEHDVFKETDTGLASVDKESMHELRGDCANLLLKMREIDKMIGTYVGQFERLAVNGKVHPYFNVMLKTMRTSCTSPNLQNVAKRNAFQKKVVRRGIKADPDCHFCEVDYSGVELYMNAFICNDSEFMKMLQTPGVDPHSEFCKFWYDFTDEQISKPIRNFSKTGVTFAQAYGSNYWACAKKTWEWFNNEEVLTGEGFNLIDHFRIKGIKTERDFIDFWQEKETEYWDRFKEWREYQEKMIDTYLQKGFAETPSGYRRVGRMSKNKILNTPPQNAGAFVLLASACYINEQARKNKMKSRLMLQVHDSNGGSVHKDEKQDFLDLIEYGMVEWTYKEFDFLKLPLGIEIEMSPEPNMSWYDLIIWNRDENGIWVPTK